MAFDGTRRQAVRCRRPSTSELQEQASGKVPDVGQNTGKTDFRPRRRRPRARPRGPAKAQKRGTSSALQDSFQCSVARGLTKLRPTPEAGDAFSGHPAQGGLGVAQPVLLRHGCGTGVRQLRRPPVPRDPHVPHVLHMAGRGRPRRHLASPRSDPRGPMVALACGFHRRDRPDSHPPQCRALVA